MVSTSSNHGLTPLTINRAFIGQFPLTLIASAVVYSGLNLPKTEDSHWKEKLRRIDFLGAFSLVIAVSCLLVGLDRGSNVSWSDTYVIIFASIFLPLFALFIFIEMKIASHPANTSFLFYLPLYFQAVDDISAAGSGLRLSKCSIPREIIKHQY
jgi:predicted membrane channel-forming protein YqfA (hemolysin III family)